MIELTLRTYTNPAGNEVVGDTLSIDPLSISGVEAVEGGTRLSECDDWIVTQSIGDIEAAMVAAGVDPPWL